MRQAGRYMEEYQRVRKNHGILDICKIPELAAEVTLQPVERFPLDAAIIFADILLPLESMGLDLTFREKEGPVILNPVRHEDDVKRLRTVDGDAFRFSFDAVCLTQKLLRGRVPLIGFAGAPFTLASYAIEGSGTRNYLTTKQMMFRRPEQWHALLNKLADVVTVYLQNQIRAGAQAVQIFDSWVGCLSPGDYREYALPHVKSIIDRLQPEEIPIIYFGTGTSTLLPLMRSAGSDVLDWIGTLNLMKRGRGLGTTSPSKEIWTPWRCLRPFQNLNAVSKIFWKEQGRGLATSSILAMGFFPRPPSITLRLPLSLSTTIVPRELSMEWILRILEMTHGCS